MNGQIKKLATTLILTIAIFALAGCGPANETVGNTTPQIENAARTPETPPAYEQAAHEPPPAATTPAWQEAYEEILQLYKNLPVGENLHLGHNEVVSWQFALHDINRDGVPELFIGGRLASGHFDYRYIYTFADGAATPLRFEGFVTDGGIFAPADGSPWIVAFLAAGSGGWYRKLEMDDNAIVPIVSGMALLSDAGHEMLWEAGFQPGYEWFNLTINDNEATADEFESVFGSWHDRIWLSFYEINEANIQNLQDLAFGWVAALPYMETPYDRYVQERLVSSTPFLNVRDSVGMYGFGSLSFTNFTYQFETVHKATFNQWGSAEPDQIAIWSSEPVYDFSFVSVLHNAICCAYIGETLLAIDKLYPYTDAVILTVAFQHYLFPRAGIIFTDARNVRHHMFIWESMESGGTARYFLASTNTFIDRRRENWLDLEIISIPASFTYEKNRLDNSISIITNCRFVPITPVVGATRMWAGYLMEESIESMAERSLAASYFLFDDGSIGYMLEFEYDIWWVREDFMAVFFRHGGDRDFFELHEDLILTVARTLTARY